MWYGKEVENDEKKQGTRKKKVWLTWRMEE
jgi:hypothetical protein